MRMVDADEVEHEEKDMEKYSSVCYSDHSWNYYGISSSVDVLRRI